MCIVSIVRWGHTGSLAPPFVKKLSEYPPYVKKLSVLYFQFFITPPLCSSPGWFPNPGLLCFIQLYGCRESERAGNERDEAKKTDQPQNRPAPSSYLQYLSSFLMEYGGTKRRSWCIVAIVRRNLIRDYSLNPPDVNAITACGCLHISLKNRYYR